MGLMTVPAGVHDAFDLVEEQFNEALDESLDPTGPGVLYDYAATRTGTSPGSAGPTTTSSSATACGTSTA
jgi:hypothetical protein